MDKPKLHSPDLTQANIDRIAELFPGCVTEARDEHGRLKRAIDFDQLRQELSDHIVEGPTERYHLNWPGKREALLAANAPIAKTLRPCREESVDFDTTKNLFIEGDNLDALKLLQETYLGRVKMIYIDPPYNTGNDFIYEDDFSISSTKYMVDSQQRSTSGEPLVLNPESNGRFHSDWLSMMLPRLRLARNILAEDGMMCVQVDDNEAANLKSVCDEVFGESNFVATICVQMSYVSGEKMAHIDKKPPKVKEFVHVYSKKKSDIKLNPQFRAREISSEYNKILLKNGSDDCASWTVEALNSYLRKKGIKNPEEVKKFKLENAEYIFNRVRSKSKLFTDTRHVDHPVKVTTATGLEKIAWHGREAVFLSSRLIKNAVGEFEFSEPLGDIWSDINITNIYQEGNVYFQNGKKPIKLIKRLVDMCGAKDGIVVDFFAGSGTTAEAVFELNELDGGDRSVILVQIPEILDEKNKIQKPSYDFCIESDLKPCVSEIAKQRMRNFPSSEAVGARGRIRSRDVGFRVMKIDTSNMQNVFYQPDAITQDDLYGQIDNIKPDRSGEDLLFQVMLDWGLDLGSTISRETIGGKTVYFVEGDDLAACFDSGIDEDFVKALAQRKPLRAVFRDTGYGSDHAKINVAQIFKLISPHTDVKAI